MLSYEVKKFIFRCRQFLPMRFGAALYTCDKLARKPLVDNDKRPKPAGHPAGRTSVTVMSHDNGRRKNLAHAEANKKGPLRSPLSGNRPEVCTLAQQPIRR